MKFIVFGNCQTGGVAASLSLLMPEAEIKSELASTNVAALEVALREHTKVNDARLIMHDSVHRIIDSHAHLQTILPEETIVIPTITFAAFHPDIQYGFHAGNTVKSGLGSDWNSQILLWAYMNKLGEQEARELFCEKVYQSVGYFDHWTLSASLLKLAFETCAFDFGRWMRSVQRCGVFMHGINHPLPIALSNLAIQIVERVYAGKHSRIEDVHQYVTDYLADSVWPIYPEIADELGVAGGYRWRVGRRCVQLDEFISLCYEAWDSIDLRKLDINLIPALSQRVNIALLQCSGRN
jgi:Polysaccharide biosynthesis enzyme WcbI